jgi:hypothetical protein
MLGIKKEATHISESERRECRMIRMKITLAGSDLNLHQQG